MKSPKHFTRLDQISQLSESEIKALTPVTDRFAFRVNKYYLSLINWKDPNDPIRRLIIPDTAELNEWGELDASDEEKYTPICGLEHKYKDTALLLVTNICNSFCRYCFRKRLFMDDNKEIIKNKSKAIKYIEEHDEINNVILSGGDPLILSTRKLEKILQPISQIDHVKVIRIGSKTPAFNPYRIVRDSLLPEMLEKYNSSNQRIYFITHFDHPRELTDIALESIDILQKAGIKTLNQNPIIKGVNDNPKTLSELYTKLTDIGSHPYYAFICRPTLGNKCYSVPVEQALDIFNKAKQNLSGIARTAKLVMSHVTGKIEVLGKEEGNIYFKYNRAANPEDEGKIVVRKSNPNAFWFDDYKAV